jgi:hypothetical protein
MRVSLYASGLCSHAVERFSQCCAVWGIDRRYVVWPLLGMQGFQLDPELSLLGGATTLYILWALTAFPLQLYVKRNSIVYINQATNNMAVALLYVIATCGSLFFSKIRMMVIFGVANLVILLAVMEFKRYAFTSLWCAYAAVASVIILAYFWRSHPYRPFLYA